MTTPATTVLPHAAPAWANPNPTNRDGQPPTQGASSASPASAEEHLTELFRPYSTLDEPVRETIMRDVSAVASKLRIVLSPLQNGSNLLSATTYGLVSTFDQGGGSGGGDGSSSHGADAANGAAGAGGTGLGSGTAAVVDHRQQTQQLSPVDQQMISSLKDWDLWGPLVLCLLLAVTLSFKAPPHQSSPVFAAVFCVVWIGSTVVTINAQLLGGTISFFQSVCVLGYSLFPLTLSALVVGLFRIFFNTWWWLDLIVIAIGFVWSIRTSSMFIGLYIKPERRFLALYPVFFFYVFVSWLILLF
jgi:hypothetical protein